MAGERVAGERVAGGQVKVRVGVALGGYGDAARYTAAVDRLEAMGVDSLWVQEMVFGPLVEPFIGMAHALARTSRLKVGTGVAVLPGRHPVLVAKQLASLAALSPGRVLPAFGLQTARADERPMFPVPAGRRGAVFDESLELLRLLLRQESVSFTGQYFTVEAASVGPLPRKPIDIWTGGSAPGALRRTGRLADGWLGSFLTPGEAGAARSHPGGGRGRWPPDRGGPLRDQPGRGHRGDSRVAGGRGPAPAPGRGSGRADRLRLG
ncbi:MAG TPA: LLM class flavin-dependent oxidoreductase [Streptosporangiaceae bacterium]